MAAQPLDCFCWWPAATIPSAICFCACSLLRSPTVAGEQLRVVPGLFRRESLPGCFSCPCGYFVRLATCCLLILLSLHTSTCLTAVLTPLSGLAGCSTNMTGRESALRSREGATELP